MLISVLQDAPTWINSFNHFTDAFQVLHWHLPHDLAVLDQPIKETDLAGDVSRAFNNFVKTGQSWAFLIGLILGYLIRTFTSFG